MRFLDLRVVVVCLCLLCALLVSGNVTLAQVVSVAPPSLAFGVPTGSVPPQSAEQLFTISVTGTGSATLSGFSNNSNITGTNAADFNISSHSCADPITITAPGSCTVGVTFTASVLTGTLESASLSFHNGDGTIIMPLSGAFGAIKLFDEVDVNPSNPNASVQNPVIYGSKTVNLSCPSEPTAVLSNTPDGVGAVLEDNYIVLKVNGSLVDTGAPAGNVCPGPLSDSNGNVNQLVCFTQAYRTPAGAGQLNGTNTDSITNANSNPLVVSPGGVAASLFNIVGFFPTANSTPVPVEFILEDGGGFVAGSTLFLKTNCTTPGTIQPGGSITSNPVDPGNPASLTPQFAFSTTPNNNVVFSADYTGTSGSENTAAATPTVTDVGIPQSAFAAFVQGTHAGPAVCLRLNAEVDPMPPHETLCKGFLIQCTTASDSTPSGGNCPQSPSDVANLKFHAKFDSLDAPPPTAGNGYNNYLSTGSNPTGSACSNTGAPCAPGTGPALLEGNDTWTSTATCFFPALDHLNGSVCPQNPITAFHGAEDPGHTVTTKNTNSLFIPVVNMPLPTDTVTLPPAYSNGWVPQGTDFTVTFTAIPATYPSTGNIPLANGFAPVLIKSETYGLTQAATNGPIPNPDGQNLNDIPTSQGCPALGTPLPNPIPTFSISPTFNLSTEGITNVHHYATDCAGSEGLNYLNYQPNLAQLIDPAHNQPSNAQLTDPSANWATFPVTQIGVDVTSPTFACGSPSGTVGPNGYTMNVTVACTVTDPGYVANVSASGFAPAIIGIQGSQTTPVILMTSVPSGSYLANAFTNSKKVCDLAGNCVTLPAMGPFVVDLLGKADLDITAGSLSPSTVKGGTLITYAVIATNYGPNKAQGVSITDVLPAGATFSSGYILNGFSLANCTGTTTVTCPIGSLNKGGVVLAFITIKAPSTPGTATSKIAIGSLNPDAASADNSVMVTTKVK
jgi:uncharacterized repeat protein (TIGR01451 family)